MLTDVLAFTLSGTRPDDEGRNGTCANGLAKWSWVDDGILLLEPKSLAPDVEPRSLLLSAGIHGDETAPIELLSFMVRDIASGSAPLRTRLMVMLGNIEAMRCGRRYQDDDLNRLFCGRHLSLPENLDAPRAARLEELARSFFARACAGPDGRWHIDMHTAIRASAFEKFALLPHTSKLPSRALFEWLGEAHMSAVFLHTTKANVYSHFTADACGATACTLELGKVRPFGQNDLASFSDADKAVRRLVAGTADSGNVQMPSIFKVVDQLTKKSDAFELLTESDVPNFTPFRWGTVLARDRDYHYVVQHEEERIVFPNPKVKPGLCAGLLVVEAPDQELSGLAGPSLNS